MSNNSLLYKHLKKTDRRPDKIQDRINWELQDLANSHNNSKDTEAPSDYLESFTDKNIQVSRSQDDTRTQPPVNKTTKQRKRIPRRTKPRDMNKPNILKALTDMGR